MNAPEFKAIPKCTRLKLTICGVVQGVGFRPFVHRLAKELALAGRISNSPQGVSIEVEGSRESLERFSCRLTAEKPPLSRIQSCEAAWLEAVGFHDFQISKSETDGLKTALLPPDIATCPDCLRELFNPRNRRYRYPFANCTNCGPRFSIINALPYDRANTSMSAFKMCPACQREYDNPNNRRFHAQPNACPVCGPQLELWSASGEAVFGGNEALLAAAQAIRRGRIVAVKGIGGFHLMADASNDEAVQLLRKRKSREEKPFALLFPSIETVQQLCELSDTEKQLLLSPAAPIVLLKKRPQLGIDPGELHIASAVAPGNPNLGVMLPSNPLHHLLMKELNFPVVATSGNLSDEPICTDEHDALERLRDIADLFLVHNRPIVRHMDDSIVRVLVGREMVLRRARGYAPLPVEIQPSDGTVHNILAVGAHLKNSVALATGKQVFISQHIGDLETEEASQAFRCVVADLPNLYDAKPDVIASDMHPDYFSTHVAGEISQAKNAPCMAVQHHVAHVLSCIAENEVELPALGVAWDGTGYGTDGTIWGGEFFLVTANQVERVAHLRPFRLPGGDAAVKEPRRVALGLLYEMFGDAIFTRTSVPTIFAFTESELQLVHTTLQRGLNAPYTTSMGRLFDAVASLTGLRQQMRFEGQAAMELEFALEASASDASYTLLSEHGRDGWEQSPIVLDWQPMIEALLADVRHGLNAADISAKFHNALVRTITGVAIRLGQKRVVLSGGCFQNRYLTEQTAQRLRNKGFQAYLHHQVPPNDGGIALGQIFAVRRGLKLKI